MSISEVFFLISDSPLIAGIVWFIGLSAALYMAREPAHRAIRSFSRVMHNGLRMSSKGLEPVQQRMSLRNREVLLAAGREASEREMERQFERIDASVQKELADTPALYRKVQEEITRLEDDYKKSAEVPPSPPGWVNAVDAVAKIPAKGDPVVVDILEDIHESLVKAHNTATDEYRQSRKDRHTILKNMMPSWRKVLQVVEVSDKNVTSLLERAKVIDRYMDDYEQILNGTDRAVRMLSSSSFTHFFVSLFVLCIAIGGAIINFNLIARPMAEMVGGNSYLHLLGFDFKVADISAMVIILIEITMGLFLMESLRITQLFPAIGSLKDNMRIRMVWITFFFLTSLACVEAGLAYMRELIVQDDLAMGALLRGQAATAMDGGFTWITTAAQMGLGFILPFALVFVAIPLETFVATLRTVLGVLGIALIRAVAFVLRLSGNGFFYFGSTLIHAYDLLVFGPLWIERMVKGRNTVPELTGGRRSKVEPPELVKEAS